MNGGSAKVESAFSIDGVRQAERKKIGGGDIKLVTVLGLYYGVFGLFQILILSGTAAIFAALPLRLQYKSKPTAIPFAPFLFLGCLFYEILSLF